MSKPTITVHDALTGVSVEREMTDVELEAIIAEGWTDDETPTPDA